MFAFLKGEGEPLQGKQSLARMESLEEKYHIAFPEVLRQLYGKYDGVSMKLSVLTVEGYTCEVAKIVPMVSEGLCFEKIKEKDLRDGLLPESFYPLARDRGGNYYYWDAGDEKVYLVFSDDYDNPFPVADRVSSFFKKLTY